MATESRDFSTISPSARALLLLKGYTHIPYAREAAELMMVPEPYERDYEQTDLTFWARMFHFESRYFSIDQLMHGLDTPNILELSSGFSFRGLRKIQDAPVHYIDTDLPELMATKKEYIAALFRYSEPAIGTLELLPLNALDESAFRSIVDLFPPGPLTIVNEGLLMYLNMEEKRILCRHIRKALEARDGYWITADAYRKMERPNGGLKMNDDLEKFFQQHHIEDNKFDSFEAAQAFFESEGFVIDKEATTDFSKLVSAPYLRKNTDPEQLDAMKSNGPIQHTWRLKLKA